MDVNPYSEGNHKNNNSSSSSSNNNNNDSIKLRGPPISNLQRWPTDWMHRHRVVFNHDSPLPTHANAISGKSLIAPTMTPSISSVSTTSAPYNNTMRPANAGQYNIGPINNNHTRSSSVPRGASNSSGPGMSLGGGSNRLHPRSAHSPCRIRFQNHPPHHQNHINAKSAQPSPRRISCHPGPTPSPDHVLLADRAERKRTLHDTTYRTYKALPRSNRPFSLRDFALLREIFAHAENLTHAEGAEIRLMDVLKAYDVVLHKHGMDPAEDTFYYRMLLKLSLGSEKDWWKKLNQEIVKNDILLKVLSFRNHKLLLYYWLQWRCHQEKGTHQDKSTRKGQFLNGQNNRSCYMGPTASQSDVDKPTFSTLQEQKYKNDSRASIKSLSYASSEAPIKDTLLVMDLIDLPIGKDLKHFSGYDLMGVVAAFQSWQRLLRQRKRKRCMKEKNDLQWKEAVCFNNKNVLGRTLKFWQHIVPTGMMQAKTWHHNFLQRKCFGVWSNYCSLMREVCESGQAFYEKRLLFLMLSEWKKYASYLKTLYEDSCKRRILLGWRQIVESQKQAVKIMENRPISICRIFLLLWRSRLASKVQHKAVLLQCQKFHKMNVSSIVFKGWCGIYYKRAFCHKQIAICHNRRSQRYQKVVIQKWREWMQEKHSQQEVLSCIISWRVRFLLKKTFNCWLKHFRNKIVPKNRCTELHYYKKRRVLLNILKVWERRSRAQKQFQDCLWRSIEFYATKLCQKSLNGWASWHMNKRHKHNCEIAIVEMIFTRQCKQILLHWKEIASLKKQEEKKIKCLKAHLKNSKKLKYWQSWWHQTVYQTTISQCQTRRNQKSVLLILNALQALAKESSKHKDIEEISLHEAGYQNSLQITEAEKHTDVILDLEKGSRNCLRTAWGMLLANAKLDMHSKTTIFRFQQNHLQLFLSLWINYAHQQKVAKGLENMKRSSSIRPFFQQWKHSAFEALEERPHISMIRRQINQFPVMHEIMNAILTICPRVILMKTFYAWREWNKAKAFKRMQKVKAWEYLAKVLQKKTLTSFKVALINANTIRWSIRHFEASHKEKALLAWRSFTKEHAIKQALNRSSILHYKSRTGSLILKSWRLHSYLLQRKEFLNRKAEIFWRNLTLCKFYRAWVDMYCNYQEKLQYFTLTKVRMDFQCLHNVLSAWRNLSQQQITQQDHLNFIQNRGRARILYQTIHLWIWYIHRKKCLRAAHEMHRRRRLKLFLHSWVIRAIQLKQRREAEDTVRNHTFNKVCRIALLVWRDVTVMARHARLNQTSTLERIRLSRITSTFFKWKDVVRSIKISHEIVNNYMLRHKQKVFHIWFEVIKQQERLTESHIAVAYMQERRTAGVIFQNWLQKTHLKRNETERNHTALIFQRQCMFVKVFKIFQVWMQDRQMKKGFALLACGKIQHLYMKWAFSSWRRQIEIYARSRAASYHLVRVSNQYFLSRVLEEMMEVVEENWRLRRAAFRAFRLNKEVIKVQKVSLLLQQHSLHSLLQYWKDKTVSSVDYRKNLLKKAWKGWIAHTQESMKLQALGETVSMWHCTLLVRQCWLRWQFQKEDAQYQQQFLLFKTMREWVKYVKLKAFWRCMEQDAKVTLLQLLQKRILWAWQSLVSEISIRREQHQQERFLQREAIVLANRNERRQKTEMLSNIFKAWQARFHQAVNISSFMKRSDKKTKQCVWSLWWSMVMQSHSEKTLRDQWVKKLLHSTLDKWCKAFHYNIEEFKRREAGAAAFSDRKRMYNTWFEWISYVSSCKDRLKVLHDCVALIQSGQSCNSLRELIHIWKDYTSERSKRREQLWAAEAAYKRHKLTDYLAAWHHYTEASKDSASSLRGTIQVYQQRGNNHMRTMSSSRYRFSQGVIGHYHNAYENDDMDFHVEAEDPRVVIEEVNSTGEDISQPSRWTRQVLLENEDLFPQPSDNYYSTSTTCATTSTTNGILHCSPHLLESGPLWNPSRSIQYVGGEEKHNNGNYGDDDDEDDEDEDEDENEGDVDEWSLA